MKLHTALAVAVFALAGCSAEVTTGGGEGDLSQSELEEKVADGVTPDDPDAEVSADCEGGLPKEVDATQDCHLDVGEETADVRITVTSTDDGDPDLDEVPFIPADRMADTIDKSLTDQGFAVDEVDCEAELIGKLGETADCTAVLPEAGGETPLKVKVTQVDGLMVNFNFEAVS
jgi:hypothetical protein